MKKTTYLLIFLASFSFCNANWDTINASNKLVAFSKYAKVGKISVFIIGAPWCAPCRVLKEDLHSANLDMKLIDIYDVQVTYVSELNQFKRTQFYDYWGKLESLTTLPRIYIASPTSTIVASFDNAGSDKSVYDRILRIINQLKEGSAGLTYNSVLQPDNGRIEIIEVKKTKNNDEIKKLNLLKNQIDSLRVTLALQLDSIKTFKNLIDSTNAKNDSYRQEFDALHKKYFGMD